MDEMIEFEKAIYGLLNRYNVFYDEIPSEFNFSKKEGVSVRIDGVTDGIFKQDIALEIQVVSSVGRKDYCMKIAREIDLMLNNAEVYGTVIVRETDYFNRVLDDNCYITLSYKAIY